MDVETRVVDETASGQPAARRSPVNHVKVTVDEEKGIACITVSEDGPYPFAQQIIELLQSTGLGYWADEGLIQKQLARRLYNEALPVAFRKDAEIDVVIEDNERKAYVILKPSYGGKELSPDDIEAALIARGVISGFDGDLVRDALDKGAYHTKVLCAEAREPLAGVDGAFHLNFRTHFEMKPKEIDHDKVDLRELGNFATVSAGRVIAWKTRATQGEAGVTVTGKPIPSKPGKEVPLKVGKGAHLSEDGTQVIADIEGHPAVKGKTISVEPFLEVPGDVDFSQGNVHFTGSVHIRGNVIGGFTVTATQNIEIDGFVESSFVEAGGDIVIRGGVQGRGVARIKAGGSVAMLFVEHARVEAGSNIMATEALHADLSARDSILVNLGKGMACGGVLRAGHLVEVRLLGSELNVPTKVSVGYDPHLKKRLESLKKEKSGIEEYMAKTEAGIATLEECKREGTFTCRRSESYERLLIAREQLQVESERVAEELNELGAAVRETVAPEIKVHDTVFPNVVLRVKEARQFTTSNWNYVTFYEEENRIKAMPLK